MLKNYSLSILVKLDISKTNKAMICQTYNDIMTIASWHNLIILRNLELSP